MSDIKYEVIGDHFFKFLESPFDQYPFKFSSVDLVKENEDGSADITFEYSTTKEIPEGIKEDFEKKASELLTEVITKAAKELSAFNKKTS